jgi:eukaryotic-like serine/threonine-protein kinase
MPLLVGAKLGPYEILAPIGSGGMGEVYRARDTRLGREVAIKILGTRQEVTPERRERFLQEARAASALNHPNIVALYDISNQSGSDFLVMELIRGKTLDRSVETAGSPSAKRSSTPSPWPTRWRAPIPPAFSIAT